ncbi:glycosyltransferase family 2 protein [Desulfosporosinus sp. SB140]|uniref:glycosyltransferase family 2 protein n=1 Tax=Desulfosporosinus paludis TaxID=3115649 RepID=UPI00388E5CCD
MYLSVVIPAHNAVAYLARSIKSLGCQNYIDFEVIVIDDGSIDETHSFADNELKRNGIQNYKVILTPSGGVSTARNRGLAASSGDYILFLDADDYISSQLVKKVVDTIKNEEPEIICWGFDIVNEDSVKLSGFFDNYKSFGNQISGIKVLKKIILEKQFWICTGSAVYKRQWLLNHNLKYTEGCANGEDQEFTYKALSQAKKVSFKQEVLTYYVRRIGSMSNSFDIKRFDVINAMLRIGEYFKSLKLEELREVIDCITNDSIISNYIYNYVSCADYLSMESKFPKKQTIEVLNCQLDNEYPGLRENLYHRMSNFKGNSIISMFKIKLFYRSSLFYCWLVRAKKTLTNYFLKHNYYSNNKEVKNKMP